MKLSPAILRAAYAMLDECEPFSRWNLPAAEDVKFKVGKDRTCYGTCTHHRPHNFTLTFTLPSADSKGRTCRSGKPHAIKP